MNEVSQDKQVDTFIYDSKEYVMTGRFAVKKAIKTKKNMYMVELRPIHASIEDDSYNKWVSIEDLYIVTTEEIYFSEE